MNQDEKNIRDKMAKIRAIKSGVITATYCPRKKLWRVKIGRYAIGKIDLWLPDNFDGGYFWQFFATTKFTNTSRKLAEQIVNDSVDFTSLDFNPPADKAKINIEDNRIRRLIFA